MEELIGKCYRDLVSEVIMQSIDDYVTALVSLKKAKKTIKEVEDFLLNSDMIDLLETEDFKIDGKEILKILKQRYR